MSVFTAIDFETADYGRDSACAVGAVVVEHGQIVQRYHQLIRPPRSRFVFTHIHGLTWNDVRSSPTFCEIWPALKEFIDGADFLVAHNASFDRGVLHRCCEAAKIPIPKRELVCTVRLARTTWKLSSASLPVVCEHLGIALKHHDPLSDAEACAMIAIQAFGHARRNGKPR